MVAKWQNILVAKLSSIQTLFAYNQLYRCRGKKNIFFVLQHYLYPDPEPNFTILQCRCAAVPFRIPCSSPTLRRKIFHQNIFQFSPSIYFASRITEYLLYATPLELEITWLTLPTATATVPLPSFTFLTTTTILTTTTF